MSVIFPAVANKGGQLSSSIRNREGLVDPRQPKGRKGGNLLICQFQAFIKIGISDRAEFINSRYRETSPYTGMIQQ
jgi:hypothetical protein